MNWFSFYWLMLDVVLGCLQVRCALMGVWGVVLRRFCAVLLLVASCYADALCLICG